MKVRKRRWGGGGDGVGVVFSADVDMLEFLYIEGEMLRGKWDNEGPPPSFSKRDAPIYTSV